MQADAAHRDEPALRRVGALDLDLAGIAGRHGTRAVQHAPNPEHPIDMPFATLKPHQRSPKPAAYRMT
jgi:hypothetical protein